MICSDAGLPWAGRELANSVDLLLVCDGSTEDLRRRIEAALQRIDRDPDDYGLCMECEEPIRRRRLELMPAVELCVKCQSAQESDRPAGRRNHLTNYI